MSELTRKIRRRLFVWAVAVSILLLTFTAQYFLPTLRCFPRMASELPAWLVLLVFVAALVCEYIDSALGMGYGTTLTPVLLLCGFDPLQIVPAVLLSEFSTGLVASVFHHHDGNVDFLRDPLARRTTCLLALLSIFGAIIGVTLAIRIPTFWLSAMIAIIIVSVGFVILATVRKQLRFRAGHILLLGAVASFNKALSGGGYGPLVTGGQVVSGIAPRQAVAVTSLAEGLTCAIGLATYFVLKQGIDWSLAPPLTLGALLSVPLATITVRRMPETTVRAAVGLSTCLLGLLMIIKLLV